MINLNFINYKESETSFFNKGIYSDIDELENKINTSKNFMHELVKVLEEMIEDKVYFSKNKSTNLINLKYNERDGHYLLLTTRRFKLLNKKLSKLKKIKVGSFSLKTSDLIISELPRSSNTKINCKKIKSISSNLVTYQSELANLLQKKFYEQCNVISEKFEDTYNYWPKRIGFGFLNSGAICAKKLGYSKPELVDNSNSFFND